MTYEQGFRTHVDLLRYRTVPDYRLKELVSVSVGVSVS